MVTRQPVQTLRPRATVPPEGRNDRSLEVIVIHTTTKATLQCLRRAAELATGLASHIRLLILQVVPYPLPVNAPQVRSAFIQRRFRTIASDVRIDTYVDIRLCRDKAATLEAALEPESIIVFEGQRGWWPGPENRLARRLERLGHHVVFSSHRLEAQN